MINILLTRIGGFFGSILRFPARGYVQPASKSIDNPYGTFALNLLGGFTFGFLAQLAEDRGVLII